MIEGLVFAALHISATRLRPIITGA